MYSIISEELDFNDPTDITIHTHSALTIRWPPSQSTRLDIKGKPACLQYQAFIKMHTTFFTQHSLIAILMSFLNICSFNYQKCQSINYVGDTCQYPCLFEYNGNSPFSKWLTVSDPQFLVITHYCFLLSWKRTPECLVFWPVKFLSLPITTDDVKQFDHSILSQTCLCNCQHGWKQIATISNSSVVLKAFFLLCFDKKGFDFCTLPFTTSRLCRPHVHWTMSILSWMCHLIYLHLRSWQLCLAVSIVYSPEPDPIATIIILSLVGLPVRIDSQANFAPKY